MNWTLILHAGAFLFLWIGLALLFEKMGFREYDKQILEEYNKKNK